MEKNLGTQSGEMIEGARKRVVHDAVNPASPPQFITTQVFCDLVGQGKSRMTIPRVSHRA